MRQSFHLVKPSYNPLTGQASTDNHPSNYNLQPSFANASRLPNKRSNSLYSLNTSSSQINQDLSAKKQRNIQRAQEFAKASLKLKKDALYQESYLSGRSNQLYSTDDIKEAFAK